MKKMIMNSCRKFIVAALAMVTSLLTLLGCGSAAQPAPAQPSEVVDPAGSNPAISQHSGPAVSEDAGAIDRSASAPDAAAPVDQEPVPAGGDVQEVTEGAELLCLVETKEEAQKIAAQYGIELVDFGYGLATFHTDRDPEEVISEGLEKGYPELSINGNSKLY